MSQPNSAPPLMDALKLFRDPQRAQQVIRAIHQQVRPGHTYRLMEFCGGHTHSLYRYALPQLLPPEIRLLHGPGCPVCILPAQRIDEAIALARRPEVILCSYGDMLRVPGSHQHSLLQARRDGADVRMVYSPLDALALAKQHPQRQVVFFAVGFETTTPPTVCLLQQAVSEDIPNLSIHCNHVLTPPAAIALLDAEDIAVDQRLQGMIGPGHVSLVTGLAPFRKLSDDYGLPIAISGFEPLDLLLAIQNLVTQINEEKARCDNTYSRAVTESGNTAAQQLMQQFLELRPRFQWRGLGELAHSGWRIRPQYAAWDAESRFDLSQVPLSREHPGCECPAVLRGQLEPQHCPLFARACTPENPLGACMVSSEGACSAHYQYRRNCA